MRPLFRDTGAGRCALSHKRILALFVTLIVVASFTGVAIDNSLLLRSENIPPPVTVFNGRAIVNTSADFSSFQLHSTANPGFYSNVTSYANQTGYASSSFHVDSFTHYYTGLAGFSFQIDFIVYAAFASNLHPINMTLNASDRGPYNNNGLGGYEFDLNRTSYNYTSLPPTNALCAHFPILLPCNCLHLSILYR